MRATRPISTIFSLLRASWRMAGNRRLGQRTEVLSAASPRRASILLAGLVALAAIPSCKTDIEPKTGSETNFLRHCESTCGDGLSCVCGVCTKGCNAAKECSMFGSNAICVAESGHADSGSATSCKQVDTCDAPCLKSADCSPLGIGYRCETGYCRQGTVVCPDSKISPGDSTRTIAVDGVTRTYALHVPANYSGDAPVPLIIDFHGMGAGAWQWEQENSGLKDLADQQGLLVAWPQGVDNTWNIGPCCAAANAPDDFGFARAIVSQLSTDTCIDPTKIYAAGFSLGGAMAYYLGCKQAEIFAAVAASSMDMFVDSEISCQPARPVSVISFRGTADTVVPYAGGTSNPPGRPDLTSELLGAKGTFEKWADLDECTGTPSAADSNGCSTYSRCSDNAEVTLCSTDGGNQIMGSAKLAWQTLKRHSIR